MKELIKIQSEIKAPKALQNKFAGFAYRNAEGIIQAAKPLNAKYGCHLTLADELMLIGTRFYVKATATLTNATGESVSATGYARETEVKKGNDDAQITGACSSYARKYALCGLYAIDDSTLDPDNDDNTEEKGKKRANKTTQAESEVTDYATVEEAVEAAKNAKTIEELQRVWGIGGKYSKHGDFVSAVTNNPNYKYWQ